MRELSQEGGEIKPRTVKINKKMSHDGIIIYVGNMLGAFIKKKNPAYINSVGDCSTRFLSAGTMFFGTEVCLSYPLPLSPLFSFTFF